MFQVEICSQQLEICKSVCMLWRLINFRLFCSDDADHDLVKKSFGPMIVDHDLVKKR